MAHDAEIFCRKAFLRNPRAKDMANAFYAERHEMRDSWPDWCGLPMAATYAILTEGAPISSAAQLLTGGAGALELSNLTAALLWDKSKIIYRYDKTLADELAQQSLDGDLPRDALFNMPYSCVFIEYEFKFDTERADGFFAWLEYDVNSGVPELRLLYLLQSGYAISMPVILSGGTLEDSYSALIASGINRAAQMPSNLPVEVAAIAPTENDVKAAINLVLYLCSEKPDIPDAQQLPKRRSRTTDGTPKRLASLEVGMRIGATLRRARSAPSQGGTHRTSEERHATRPHMRRAHWHTYWTGTAGERKAIVKWLPPIAVGADGDAEVVIFPVK